MDIAPLHCIYSAPSRILAFWLILSVLRTTLNKAFLSYSSYLKNNRLVPSRWLGIWQVSHRSVINSNLGWVGQHQYLRNGITYRREQNCCHVHKKSILGYHLTKNYCYKPFDYGGINLDDWYYIFTSESAMLYVINILFSSNVRMNEQTMLLPFVSFRFISHSLLKWNCIKWNNTQAAFMQLKQCLLIA